MTALYENVLKSGCEHGCLTLKYLIRHIKGINSSYTGVMGKETTANVSKYYRKK